MSKLSTKKIETKEEGSILKNLRPGNEKCIINSVELKDSRFNAGELELILNLEGPDLGKEFVGFQIDREDPSKGNHKGQTARVKASYWAFKDSTTKKGIEIKRDEEIMKFVKQLCDSLDITKWFVDQDEKHDTIQQFVEAFNTEKPFANKPMNYCICGKEYINKKGYKDYELYLPKFSSAGKPFHKDAAKVVIFNVDDHIIKAKEKPVSSFDTPSESSGGGFEI